MKKHFRTVFLFKLEDELNEIAICEKQSSNILNELTKGCDELNKFFKRSNCKEQMIDKNEFLKTLIIQSSEKIALNNEND